MSPANKCCAPRMFLMFNSCECKYANKHKTVSATAGCTAVSLQIHTATCCNLKTNINTTTVFQEPAFMAVCQFLTFEPHLPHLWFLIATDHDPSALPPARIPRITRVTGSSLVSLRHRRWRQRSGRRGGGGTSAWWATASWLWCWASEPT